MPQQNKKELLKGAKVPPQSLKKPGQKHKPLKISVPKYDGATARYGKMKGFELDLAICSPYDFRKFVYKMIAPQPRERELKIPIGGEDGKKPYDIWLNPQTFSELKHFWFDLTGEISNQLLQMENMAVSHISHITQNSHNIRKLLALMIDFQPFTDVQKTTLKDYLKKNGFVAWDKDGNIVKEEAQIPDPTVTTKIQEDIQKKTDIILARLNEVQDEMKSMKGEKEVSVNDVAQILKKKEEKDNE